MRFLYGPSVPRHPSTAVMALGVGSNLSMFIKLRMILQKIRTHILAQLHKYQLPSDDRTNPSWMHGRRAHSLHRSLDLRDGSQEHVGTCRNPVC